MPAEPRSTPIEFEEVFEAWFNRVSSWVRALGGPESDQEDLVQDVFLVVHRRLADFDGRNMAGWLYQIARRRVRDFRRLHWIRHVLARRVPLSNNLLKAGPGPADYLETQEKARELEAMLSTLNPDQRAAFVLLEIEGYSGEEIARLQSVPLNTVWARIYKARKRLQQQLELRQAQPGKSSGR
ncbi:MAG TPA: RNA polymerase sigma factor [Polyangiaceae bacterium]|nr:RNA polymerase sigma factor [Polyangiaceae bacterium]